MTSSSIRRFRWPSYAVATLITGYQKYLSPFKGFSCAHRVLHGSESCSQHVKQTILQKGLSDAWPDSRQRFRDCRSAYLTIMASRNDQNLLDQEGIEDDRNKNKRNSPSCCSPNSNNLPCSADCFEILNFPCVPHTIRAIDCDLASCVPSFDLAACDLGACDISGCDIGSCDIGGCDVGSC